MEKVLEGRYPNEFYFQATIPGNKFLSLLLNDFPSPYYLTFLQCKEKSGKILSGSKGDPIIYWSIKDFQIDEEHLKKAPLLQYSYVFNLSQTNLYENKCDIHKHYSCEELITSLKEQPTIKHNISRCYYSPIDDYISLPIINDFEIPEEYYSSLFHELIHWTSSPSRLNRNLDYATEECVAEIGSAYLCALCRIDTSTCDNSLSYIDSWYEKIKNNSKSLIEISKEAQKAVDYLLN